jgi:hypothetical protein
MVLIVFNDLVLRLLVLARRRIAIKKAIANQKLHLETASDTGTVAGDGARSLEMETIVEMSKIDKQTRKLLKLVVFILALAF